MTSYGAKCNGFTDDTTAIQSALNAVPSGSTLTFPGGTCVYSNVLTLSTNNVTLQGRQGGALQAESAADQSLVLAGNNDVLMGMTLKGAGSTRLSTPQSTSLEVTGSGDKIVGNNISGAASGGIFVYGATNYLIKNNTVYNTLADGIHQTNASQNGVVEGNTVYNTGDDMIAVVSYSNESISGHILIANNNVSGNTWGRGITCVGCDTVVISDNTVSNVPCAAGIYVWQESKSTLGVNGVLVKGNQISNVQTAACPGGTQTYQSGIDVGSAGDYPVQYVSLQNNAITGSAWGGVRVLDYGAAGSTFNHLNLNSNVLTNITNTPINMIDDPGAPRNATCYANTSGGSSYTVGGCTAQNVSSAAWTQFNFAATPPTGP